MDESKLLSEIRGIVNEAMGRNESAIKDLSIKMDILARGMEKMMEHFNANIVSSAKALIEQSGTEDEASALSTLNQVVDMAPPKDMLQTLSDDLQKKYDSLFKIANFISENMEVAVFAGKDLQEDASRKNRFLENLSRQITQHIEDSSSRHGALVRKVDTLNAGVRGGLSKTADKLDKLRPKPVRGM